MIRNPDSGFGSDAPGEKIGTQQMVLQNYPISRISYAQGCFEAVSSSSFFDTEEHVLRENIYGRF
jgi:hypothetical protein